MNRPERKNDVRGIILVCLIVVGFVLGIPPFLRYQRVEEARREDLKMRRDIDAEIKSRTEPIRSKLRSEGPRLLDEASGLLSPKIHGKVRLPILVFRLQDWKDTAVRSCSLEFVMDANCDLWRADWAEGLGRSYDTSTTMHPRQVLEACKNAKYAVIQDEKPYSSRFYASSRYAMSAQYRLDLMEVRTVVVDIESFRSIAAMAFRASGTFPDKVSVSRGAYEAIPSATQSLPSDSLYTGTSPWDSKNLKTFIRKCASD